MQITNIQQFLQKWDNGAGWSFADNNTIDDSEVQAKGGYAQLVADFETLPAGSQEKALEAIERGSAKEGFWQKYAPEAHALIKEFDIGWQSFWLFTNGDGNGRLETKELEGDKLPPFTSRLNQLGLKQQFQTVRRIDSSALASGIGAKLKASAPALFDPKDFRCRLISKKDNAKADEVREFLRDKWGISPGQITSGFGADNLPAIPHGVPATPEEQLIADMTPMLADGRRLDILEMKQVLDAAYPRSPRLTVPQLVHGLATAPGRFEGVKVELTGYAKHVDTKRYSTMVYAYTYDVLEGEWGFKLVSKPVVETIHHFYAEPEFTPASQYVEVFDRDEASSFFSVGVGGFGFSMDSANGVNLDPKQYIATGVIQTRNGGHRLILRDIETE